MSETKKHSIDPKRLYPIPGFTNTVLLRPLAEKSGVDNVDIGEFTYYHYCPKQNQ